MNWILLLIVLMFAAILAGPASADTVTAAIPAVWGDALLSNPTYALTVCGIVAVVVYFFGLLWWAGGSDRPKVKADLLHVPQKPVEPPNVRNQLLDAAEKHVYTQQAGEYLTFQNAQKACVAKEPTWLIREEYNLGVVQWRLYKISYQVKACRGRPFWRISDKPFRWGAQDGYNTLDEAQAVMEGFLSADREQRKPRESLYYDREGQMIKTGPQSEAEAEKLYGHNL